MKIVPLSPEYDRSLFDCGEPELNDYLKLYAGQHGRKGQSRTLHYGFRELLDDPLHLFLPLRTARKLV
jgi:hypothetical protein